MSFRALLKFPKIGGIILRISIAAHHVCFILFRSLHVRASPEAFPFAISCCSMIIDRRQNRQGSSYIHSMHHIIIVEVYLLLTMDNNRAVDRIVGEVADHEGDQSGRSIIPGKHDEH